MTRETIQQLQAIGLEPAKVAAGVTFAANGFFFKDAEFLKETNGIKLFRTTRNGQPRMLAQEQMIAIFA